MWGVGARGGRVGLGGGRVEGGWALGHRSPHAFASSRVTFAGPQNLAKPCEGCSKWRVGGLTQEDAKACGERTPRPLSISSKHQRPSIALGHASRAQGTVADNKSSMSCLATG